MGGFTEFIPAAISVGTQILGAQNSQDNAQAQLDAQNQAIARQNQLLVAQQAKQDQDQRTQLAQNQASLIAQMGASGADGGDGGSADALLQGMSQRANNNIDYIDQTTGLRLSPYKPDLLDAANNLQWAKTGMGVFSSFYGD